MLVQNVSYRWNRDGVRVFLPEAVATSATLTSNSGQVVIYRDEDSGKPTIASPSFVEMSQSSVGKVFGTLFIASIVERPIRVVWSDAGFYGKLPLDAAAFVPVFDESALYKYTFVDDDDNKRVMFLEVDGEPRPNGVVVRGPGDAVAAYHLVEDNDPLLPYLARSVLYYGVTVINGNTIAAEYEVEFESAK